MTSDPPRFPSSGAAAAPGTAGTTVIDLNADLGEGFGVWRMGDDEALLQVVSSANIACGFHAGDPTTMRRTCRTAHEHGVRIGAHVSYPDLRGFGRYAMSLPPGVVRDDVVYQVGALQAVARTVGATVRHVKAHGALYHAAAQQPDVAEAVADAVVDLGADLVLLGPPRGCLRTAADARGLRYEPEGFADRAYRSDGTLVPRERPGALLHDPGEIGAQAVRLALGRPVTGDDGGLVRVPVRTVCLHGDTPAAVGMARAVRAALSAAGVRVAHT